MSDVARVHSVIAKENEVHGNLKGFLEEYTVQKVLVGKSIGRSELQNQNRFVGTIVSAEVLQREKLGKLSEISKNKSSVLVVKDKQLKQIDKKLDESKKAEAKALEVSEDQENIELFNAIRRR